MSGLQCFGKRAVISGEKMECGICCHVYDPAAGDPVSQIPQSTPFADLPEDWCCPNCDAPQSKFMRLGDDR
ncbi:rubredoxin [Ensifer aridi]|uniref:rubredoxin n=1 Tax=Ensifer aridi TaxID=1708715 RepID=UPI000A12251C|nr:rubredoxin [Ensifer aridi]